MVTPNKEFDDMIDPVEQKEPNRGYHEDTKKFDPPKGIWMRGLMIIIVGIMFALARVVLTVVALVQFVWMVVTREKNPMLAEFGEDMAKWLADAALFQTAASDEKPFPWKKWGE